MGSFWEKAAAAAGRQARSNVVEADFPGEREARRAIRRDPPPTPSSLLPTDDELMLRLADEIEYACRMLQRMGDELSSDGLVVSRHTAELQTLDIAGQMLGHIAAVLRSNDIADAVDRIGMAELKARLLRRRRL